MYTDKNYKTKKALKEDVKVGKRVTFYQPNDMRGIDTTRMSGIVYLEGPHYPEPHKWYARCEAKDGVIVKVLS